MIGDLFFPKLIILLKENISEDQTCEVPVVSTGIGDFCGVRQTIAGHSVNAYLGVPFAQPPIGKLRLQPPKQIDHHLGFLSTDHYAPTCYHTLWESYDGFVGEQAWNPPDRHVSEDCLKLNIWVPGNLKSSEKLPVMVWIFGGGFISGSPSLDFYNGSVLAALQEVIVVNINYRVGALGFTSFGPKSSISGNFGLLDQQAALRWIHEKIGDFGGDPNKVTLFGESAGSASVTSHLFAPDSHPFFQRVAASSGTMIHHWATNPDVTDSSAKLAKLLGCHGNEEAILECLQGVEVAEFQQAADSLATGVPIQFTFTPISDDPLFFKGNVHDRFESGDFKRDFSGIFGLVEDEGSYFLPYYLGEERYGFVFDPKFDTNSEENSAKLNWTQFENSINVLGGYFGEDAAILQQVQQLYLNTYQIDRNSLTSPSPFLRDSIARLYSDQFFNCDFTHFIEHISKFITGNIYFYHFRERSTSNPWPKWMGVMHGYEIEYYFGVPVRSPDTYESVSRESEKRFSENLMQMWADFARNGSPSPNWRPHSESQKRLVLDKKLNDGIFEHIADPHHDTCIPLLNYRRRPITKSKIEL
ncbi:unnamed protein product, partial [Mesorhabditis belari]|uniref:Carboxylic ester hydrolase n=1 Tax=Mesorhabditis belari TaxID=2138241 RepID=A0AAF3F476_9BILA